MKQIVRLFAVLFAFGACQEKVPEPEAGSNVLLAPKPSATAAKAAEPPVPSAAPSAAGSKKLVKEELAPGKGPAAKTGDTVKVHYTGTLLDGTKFDSSRDRDEPFEFTLGQGQVIRGWDDGVVGMKKGGKRKLTIPGDLAYGKTGRPPTIPPDATLVFDIELMEIAAQKAQK